jgi:hypothetical protein
MDGQPLDGLVMDSRRMDGYPSVGKERSMGWAKG